MCFNGSVNKPLKEIIEKFKSNLQDFFAGEEKSLEEAETYFGTYLSGIVTSLLGLYYETLDQRLLEDKAFRRKEVFFRNSAVPVQMFRSIGETAPRHHIPQNFVMYRFGIQQDAVHIENNRFQHRFASFEHADIRHDHRAECGTEFLHIGLRLFQVHTHSPLSSDPL